MSVIKFYRAYIMKINDMIHLKGEVLLQTLSTNRELCTLVDDKNLIVLNGRMSICKALAGVSSQAITDIAFGSGGTVVGVAGTVSQISNQNNQSAATLSNNIWACSCHYE